MTRRRPPQVEITPESDLWHAIADIETIIGRAVTAAVTESGATLHPAAELSVVLSDDAHVRALNRDWRQIDKATNVLSFPAVQGALSSAPLLGDIVLAYETLEREAQAEGKPLDHHLAHLVVHGTLHLFGFDHETDDEAEDMEALERQALQRLGIPDPYAVPLSATTQPVAAGM